MATVRHHLKGRRAAAVFSHLDSTARRPYSGRRTPKSSDSCGCRRNSAVAAGPPYGEFLCFYRPQGWPYNYSAEL